MRYKSGRVVKRTVVNRAPRVRPRQMHPSVRRIITALDRKHVTKHALKKGDINVAIRTASFLDPVAQASTTLGIRKDLRMHKINPKNLSLKFYGPGKKLYATHNFTYHYH